MKNAKAVEAFSILHMTENDILECSAIDNFKADVSLNLDAPDDKKEHKLSNKLTYRQNDLRHLNTEIPRCFIELLCKKALHNNCSIHSKIPDSPKKKNSKLRDEWVKM